jgi:hypothetical protein
MCAMFRIAGAERSILHVTGACRGMSFLARAQGGVLALEMIAGPIALGRD